MQNMAIIVSLRASAFFTHSATPLAKQAIDSKFGCQVVYVLFSLSVNVLFFYRLLTYSYLVWYNFYLLFCPNNLSYDYSTGAIPLVTSVIEARAVLTLLFFVLFGGFAVLCCYSYLLKVDYYRMLYIH